MLEYIRHLEELQIVSMITENIPDCTPSIPNSGGGGGALEILKTWRGGHRKFTNNLNRGPVKI
jgi:hypothetical protein